MKLTTISSAIPMKGRREPMKASILLVSIPMLALACGSDASLGNDGALVATGGAQTGGGNGPGGSSGGAAGSASGDASVQEGGQGTTTTGGPGTTTTTTGPGTGGAGGTGTTTTGGPGTGGAGGPGTTTTGGPGTTTTTTTGGPGTGGQGGGAGAGGAKSDGGVGQSNAIALFRSQLVPSGQGQNWLDTGEQLQPTTLLVAVNKLGPSLSCTSPDFTSFAGPGGSTNRDFVVVGLPDSMQKPGTYPFASTDVIAYRSFWLTDGMSGGGGGSAPLKSGSIEVVSLSTDFVDMRLSGIGSVEDGDYRAARCH